MPVVKEINPETISLGGSHEQQQPGLEDKANAEVVDSGHGCGMGSNVPPPLQNSACGSTNTSFFECDSSSSSKYEQDTDDDADVAAGKGIEPSTGASCRYEMSEPSQSSLSSSQPSDSDNSELSLSLSRLSQLSAVASRSSGSSIDDKGEGASEVVANRDFNGELLDFRASMFSTSEDSSSSDVECEVDENRPIDNSSPNRPPDEDEEDLQRLNRRNILKTVEGLSRVISNWSMTTTKGGEEFAMCLDGDSLTHAYRIHNHPVWQEPQQGSYGSIMSEALSQIKELLMKPVPYRDMMENHGGSQPGPSTSAQLRAYLEGLNSVKIANHTSNSPSPTTEADVASQGDSEDGNSLDAEMAEEHGPVKYWQRCAQCPLIFYSRVCFVRHVIQDHSRERRFSKSIRDTTFECTCGKVFGHKRNMMRHSKNHAKNGNKPSAETM